MQLICAKGLLENMGFSGVIKDQSCPACFAYIYFSYLYSQAGSFNEETE